MTHHLTTALFGPFEHALITTILGKTLYFNCFQILLVTAQDLLFEHIIQDNILYK